MKDKQPVKLEDLLWAREKLRVFTSLERQLKTYMGKNGFENLILRNPFIIGLLIFSTIINIFGMWLWGSHKGHIFLLSSLWPSICAYFIYVYALREKKKNIYRFIGKYPIVPMNLINLIEYHIFREQESLEEIIEWRKNKNHMNEQEVAKFKSMFEVPSWENPKQAQKHCLSLGILMVSIQRFLHLNRQTYESQVYRPRPKRSAQKDMTSFNGARISEDEDISIQELFDKQF